MRMREGVVVSLLLLMAAGWACGTVVLWSEDFEGYDVGDLLPQDGTYTLSSQWDLQPWPTAAITDEYPADVLGEAGNKALMVSKGADAGHDHRGYAHKDLTGLITTPTQSVVTVELDIFHRHAIESYWGNREEFKIGGPAGVMVHLNIYDATGADWSQWLNDEAFTGAWEPWTWRHYRFDIDFDAGTVAMTIDDEAAPRLTVPLLAGDFSPADLTELTFGSGLFYRTGRVGSSWFDNVVIHEVPEPATLSLLALGALATLRRRK